jgi:stage II sporulation protein M
MVKKKKEGLVKEYSESWEYLKGLKFFILAILGIFLFAGIFGYFVQPPDNIYNQIINYIQELIQLTEGKSLFGLIVFIFVNNLKSSFFSIIFGVVFGIFPAIAAFANGYFLGFVSRITINSEGFSVLWHLVPHGIFELPAIFISFALGLKLGTFIFGKKKKETFVDYLWNSIRIFLLVVLPLLVVAAIIEGILIFVSR